MKLFGLCSGVILQSHMNAHFAFELLSDERDKKQKRFNHSVMFTANLREQDKDLIT